MNITGKRVDNATGCWGDHLLAWSLGHPYRKYREDWEMVSRREKVTDFPLYLQLEITPRCNLKCRSCIHGYPDLSRKYADIDRVLPDDLYLKILEEASRYGCPSISFHNNCEPMLDPHLEEKIALARKAGFLDLILVTNGTLLTEERSSRLLRAGITKISFSIDAFSREGYERLRIGSDFLKVRGNILAFLEIKRREHRVLPITRVSFVITRENSHEVEPFREYWEDKVDKVDFQCFCAIEGYNESLAPAGSRPVHRFPCSAPWQQLVIRANGDVVPCCSFYGSEMVIGNIRETSIHDLWLQPRMVQLREALGSFKNLSATCVRCMKTRYEPPGPPSP